VNAEFVPLGTGCGPATMSNPNLQTDKKSHASYTSEQTDTAMGLLNVLH